MELRLEQAIKVLPALKVIATKELPATSAYWIGKLYDRCAEEVNRYNKANYQLCKRLGKLVDDADDTYRVKPDNQEQYDQEHDELVKQPIDLADIKPVDFEHIKDLTLSPVVMGQLDSVLVNKPT